jgi:hypothetical protein
MSTSLFAQIDSSLESLFHSWNIYSTTLLAILIIYSLSPLYFATEPDIHPFLLARQSQPSSVRHPGQSAVYRSTDVPHGYPLRTGLNVKDKDAPKYISGRDGDLRDVWRRACEGAEGKLGVVYTVRGRTVGEHTLPELTKDLDIVGKFVKSKGLNRVAVCLPNSVELVVSLFAATFYEFVVILVAPGIETAELKMVLRETGADGLIISAGVVAQQDLDSLGLKQIISVVEQTSRQVDWKENVPPGGMASEWHDILANGPVADAEDPKMGEDYKPPNVVIADGLEIVEYEQKVSLHSIRRQHHVLTNIPRI